MMQEEKNQKKKRKKGKKEKKKEESIKFHALFVLKYIFSVLNLQLFYQVEKKSLELERVQE